VGLQSTSSRVEWQTSQYSRLVVAEGLATDPEYPTSEQVIAWRDAQARLHPEVGWAARISCLPTQVAGLIACLAEFPQLLCTADCAIGVISIAAPDPDPAPVPRLLQLLPADANLVWTRLDSNDPSGVTVDRWGKPRSEFELHRALKKAIDPAATFSPGRFLGRL